MWSSSDSDNEEEEKINIYDTESNDSDMLEILSCPVYNYWEKGELKIYTYFTVTVLMLCVISQIHKDASDNSDSNHRKQVKNMKRIFKWVI